MRKALNIGEWVRKDQFQFFSRFEEPFFGICVQVDCTRAYSVAKSKGFSFFLYYLHCSLSAANAIEPFRYRIEDNNVYEYDRVDASPTINRPDGTFGFAYLQYLPAYQDFVASAQPEIDAVRVGTGLIPAVSGENVIHFSSIPWINFTSISHARSFTFNDSIPKISFGKMIENGDKKMMPVSVHVHHGLMDGFHVGQFVDRFQQLLNSD